MGKETIHGEEIQEIKTVIRKTASKKAAAKGEGKPTPREGKIEKFDIISEYTDVHEKGFSKTPDRGAKIP